MRYWFLLLFSLLFVNNYSAQEKNIVVILKDAVTKESISGASVSVKNSNQGAISNEEGVFKLSVASPSNIQVSHIAYKTIVIPSNDLKQGETTVFMDLNDVTMEEIIISKTPIYEVLASLIDNSRQHLSNPVHLNTYCREFVKNHGKYTRFTDGLVDLHIKGKPKNIDVDAVAIQNRSYGLNEEEQASQMLVGFNLDDIIEKTYEFGGLKKFTKKSSLDSYDFEIKSNPANENIYIIQITPKKEVEELLFNVKVAYDINKKVILSVEQKTADSHLQYSKEINLLIARALIKKSHFKAEFKFENNKYVLSNTLADVHFKLWNKRKINYDMEVKNALIVTKFQNENFTYNSKDVIKNGRLVKQTNNIKTNYWEFDSGLTPTNEEQAVIDNLKTKL